MYIYNVYHIYRTPALSDMFKVFCPTSLRPFLKDVELPFCRSSQEVAPEGRMHLKSFVGPIWRLDPSVWRYWSTVKVVGTIEFCLFLVCG